MSVNGGKERSDAMEEKVYKCTKALLIDHEKGFTEIPVDSTWMFMGGSEGRGWLGKNALMLADSLQELPTYFNNAQKFLDDYSKYWEIYDYRDTCKEALSTLWLHEPDKPQEGDEVSYTLSVLNTSVDANHVTFYFHVAEIDEFAVRYAYDYCVEDKEKD